MPNKIEINYELRSTKFATEKIQEALDSSRPMIKNGAVADYIPELGKADPEHLGICFAPLSGPKICLGDYDVRFTIQSISKVMSLCVALELFGPSKLMEVVGVEPSGEAFNSLVELEKETNKPYNPLVNSGALAVDGLLQPVVSFEELLRFTREVCSDPDIELNQAVFESEMKTCSRNRAIGYLLQSKNIIKADVEEVLEYYTRMCSLNVTAVSLANFALMLANDGVNIDNGKRYLSANTVRIAKTLMLTCGMYDGSGTFAVTVGIPTKSGVGGGLMSVSDKRAGIGVFGPSLDKVGNSIAGCEILRQIAIPLRLELFYNPEWLWEDIAKDSVISDIVAPSQE